MMREFVLDKRMVTMGGVFYPKGHAVVMFPHQADADATAAALVEEAGFSDDEVQRLAPATVLRQIAQTDDGADIPLPSLGTEGATVRAFQELAHRGHHGLIVAADSAADTERMMCIVRRVPFSLAQKYRALVIEDLK
ncbi:MAG: RNA-binding protein [Pseudomonadota bacterium]